MSVPVILLYFFFFFGHIIQHSMILVLWSGSEPMPPALAASQVAQLSGKEYTRQNRRPGFNPEIRKIPWRRTWQPTPVILPGKFHGQRSLAGYSPWGRKESDMTERAHLHTNAALTTGPPGSPAASLFWPLRVACCLCWSECSFLFPWWPKPCLL